MKLRERNARSESVVKSREGNLWKGGLAKLPKENPACGREFR